jgi:aryl-alcohol dehydrogenase-like predicted oxidoreductase
MTLSGYATLTGTTRYRDRFPTAAPHHFRHQQKLLLSSIGIGTYLGNADAATDHNYTQAAVRAVQLGANVIDSAANYRFQRSERSIGEALRILTQEHGFQRDELVVCTKGGYIPFDGAPPRNIRSYLEETFVQPGIANLGDFVGGSHCMTPRYLQNQIEQSLRNLNLECLDVYYIHNPESQLNYVSAAEFEHRLTAAFELLEQNRAQGKLQLYGVATWNGFRLEADEPGYHSLTGMAALAAQVGGENHGFRFIQLPFNLGMPEAFTLPNQILVDKEMTVLEAAAALDITVVASASILQGKVARELPDSIKEPLGSLTTDAQTAIQFVRSTPGIATALVGMSRVEHVVENLQLASIEPVAEEQFARLAT